MIGLKEEIILIGRYLFLAGVALLIVRNNSYPFFIKRSSDFLFFLSAIAALYIVFRFKEGYKNFFERKNVLIGLFLICLGLIIASLSGYFYDNLAFTKEGLLNIGRFSEVFIIIFLVSFFQSFDGSFYKKVALAQLSALIYLPTLFFPNADFVIAMYRFNLFENWPSNVGYYLIVSITCIAVLTLKKISPLKKTLFVYYALGIGLSAILLWAQSRAAWLGTVASILLLILFWAEGNYKKITAGVAAAILAFAVSFLFLRSSVQKDVLVRVITQNIDLQSANNHNMPAQNTTAGLFADSHRLDLWKVYLKKLLRSPLGFGVNYEPIDIGAGKQGPHNTILEFLVLAGPLGLAGVILLLWSAFKNLWGKMRIASYQNRIWFAYIFCSLAGIIIASMFDNMSLFRLIWLMTGIGLFV